MDFINLIRSIEELIYEICLWLLQIPKTFFKIATSPKWVTTYVPDELQKEEKKQFQDYISPMLFWILIVVIPAFIILKSISEGLKPEDKTFIDFLGESLQNRILVVSTFLVLGPLTFAVGIHKKQGKTITKESFKENFFIQLYSFSPLQFFLVWILLAASEFDSPVVSITNWSMSIAGGIYSWWFVYYETRIIKLLLNTTWLRAILWMIPLAIIGMIFTVIVVVFLISLYLPDLD